MSEGKPLPHITQSRSHNREVWVGAFVILGVAAGLLALFTMTDASLFRGRYVVFTTVPNAGGIRRGDPVQMRGVNIGRIARFHILSDQVRIHLEIEGEYDVPADSRVQLASSGMLGGMVANVVPGTSPTPAAAGVVLPGTSEVGLFQQVEEVQGQASGVLTQVGQLLDESAIRDVHASARDLSLLLQQLRATVRAQQEQVGALTGRLRRSAEALEQTVGSPHVDGSLRRLEGVLARLDTVSATLDQAAGSAASVLARLDAGQGTLGKLTTDTQLYDNLSEAAASIQRAADEVAALTADLRQNPDRYVRLSLF